MAQNMYRVGDYVYFEISSAAPYQVRRIEELNKTSTGNVEAKVMCFYRRRDISPALLDIADQLPPDAVTEKMKAKVMENGELGTSEDGHDENLEHSGKSEERTEEKSEKDQGEQMTAIDGRPDSVSPSPMQVDESVGSEQVKVENVMEEKRETVNEEVSGNVSGKWNAETAGTGYGTIGEICQTTGERQAIGESQGVVEEGQGIGERQKTEEREDIGEKQRTEETDGIGERQKTEERDAIGERQKTEREDIGEKQRSGEREGIGERQRSKEREGIGERQRTREKEGSGLAGLPTGADRLPLAQVHLLRQRELFLSRQIETLPATHIRGKCVVTLLNEVEVPDSYLLRHDAFFYSLVYDPSAKTLLADKGEIRVGDKYQAMVPDMLTEEKRSSYPESPKDTLVFRPDQRISERDIDQLLIVARAVGTFSRALDTSSSVKLPSLHMTAAAASRDVTLFHAMALLHQADYDLGQAMKFLVPPPSKEHYPLNADKTTSHNTVSLGGPVLCRDQMEEWSAAEANLFEEAIEKYGKDFNDIRQDFLPWKALKDIVEYYYMWKTTDRYVQSKRVKAQEAESRLKQVYIPNYNKPNPNLVGPPNPTGQPVRSPTTPCESCKVELSPAWYAWGPAHLQMRLCADCWASWKKCGGLRRNHQYENYDKNGTTTKPGAEMMQNATGMARGSTLPSQITGPRTPYLHQTRVSGHSVGGGSSRHHVMGPSGTPKTRLAFFLHTTLMTRVARRLSPRSLYNARKSARRPFLPLNSQAIKQNCQSRDPKDIVTVARQIKGGRIPAGMVEALNRAVSTSVTTSNVQKRPLSNGDVRPIQTGQPSAKMPRQTTSWGSKVRVSQSRVCGPTNDIQLKAQAHMYTRWMTLNEDVFYMANPGLKQLRRTAKGVETRHLARGPCRENAMVGRLLPRLALISHTLAFVSSTSTAVDVPSIQ